MKIAVTLMEQAEVDSVLFPKGLFTPQRAAKETKAKKIKANDKYRRKFLLSLPLLLGVNRPLSGTSLARSLK